MLGFNANELMLCHVIYGRMNNSFLQHMPNTPDGPFPRRNPSPRVYEGRDHSYLFNAEGYVKKWLFGWV